MTVSGALTELIDHKNWWEGEDPEHLRKIIKDKS